jgi:hypothetical protein
MYLCMILLVALILEHKYRHVEGGMSIGEESGEDANNKKILFLVVMLFKVGDRNKITVME